MGHRISAIICKLPINYEKADELDLPVFVESDFAIIALDASHSDHWAEALGVGYNFLSDMMHDSAVTQAFAKALGISKFALINTEYFGGVGEQHATAYENGQRTLCVTSDGINKALSMIGVTRSDNKDEFDSIGLGKYRHFDDHFEKYWD
ncbi:MAG: hypothetical protein ACU0BB_09515 [Paracoccaceae bacterium]